MQLSPNFNLYEFTRSRTAEAHGIDNRPQTQELLANGRALCQHALEPARECLGVPLSITSGYRSPALNRALRKVGASRTSQHMQFMAADIRPVGMNVTEAFYKLRKVLPKAFDQVILEPSWIHISYNRLGVNRNQWLIARRVGKGKYRYYRA